MTTLIVESDAIARQGIISKSESIYSKERNETMGNSRIEEEEISNREQKPELLSEQGRSSSSNRSSFYNYISSVMKEEANHSYIDKKREERRTSLRVEREERRASIRAEREERRASIRAERAQKAHMASTISQTEKNSSPMKKVSDPEAASAVAAFMKNVSPQTSALNSTSGRKSLMAGSTHKKVMRKSSNPPQTRHSLAYSSSRENSATSISSNKQDYAERTLLHSSNLNRNSMKEHTPTSSSSSSSSSSSKQEMETCLPSQNISTGRTSLIGNTSKKNLDAVASLMASSSSSSQAESNGRPSLVGNPSQTIPGARTSLISSASKQNLDAVAAFMASTSAQQDPSGRPSLLGSSTNNSSGARSSLLTSASRQNLDAVASFMASTSSQLDPSGRPSLIGASNAGRTSLIGGRTSLVGQRTSLVGQRTSLVGQTSPLVGQRTSLIGQRTSLVGQRTSLVASNHNGNKKPPVSNDNQSAEEGANFQSSSSEQAPATTSSSHDEKSYNDKISLKESSQNESQEHSDFNPSSNTSSAGSNKTEPGHTENVLKNKEKPASNEAETKSENETKSNQEVVTFDRNTLYEDFISTSNKKLIDDSIMRKTRGRSYIFSDSNASLPTVEDDEDEHEENDLDEEKKDRFGQRKEHGVGSVEIGKNSGSSNRRRSSAESTGGRLRRLSSSRMSCRSLEDAVQGKFFSKENQGIPKPKKRLSKQRRASSIDIRAVSDVMGSKKKKEERPSRQARQRVSFSSTKSADQRRASSFDIRPLTELLPSLMKEGEETDFVPKLPKMRGLRDSISTASTSNQRRASSFEIKPISEFLPTLSKQSAEQETAPKRVNARKSFYDTFGSAVANLTTTLQDEAEKDFKEAQTKEGRRKSFLFGNDGDLESIATESTGVNSRFGKLKTFVNGYLSSTKSEEQKLTTYEKADLISQDIEQFRELQKMIRSSGLVTNAAAKKMLPDLINCHLKESDVVEPKKRKKFSDLKSFRLTKDHSQANGMNWKSKINTRFYNEEPFDFIALKDDDDYEEEDEETDISGDVSVELSVEVNIVE